MAEEVKKEEVKVETPPQKEDAAKADTQVPPKKERTRIEKLRHTKASIEAQIAEEEVKEGIIITDDEDDSKPLTRGDLKRMQRDDSKRKSLDLANEIKDEDERSQVIEILQTRILPSGNAQKDLDFALSNVRSEKNRQIAEEASRKRNVQKNHSSGSGSPAREDEEFVPTETELRAAQIVGKKTPEDVKKFILKARARENK